MAETLVGLRLAASAVPQPQARRCSCASVPAHRIGPFRRVCARAAVTGPPEVDEAMSIDNLHRFFDLSVNLFRAARSQKPSTLPYLPPGHQSRPASLHRRLLRGAPGRRFPPLGGRRPDQVESPRNRNNPYPLQPPPSTRLRLRQPLAAMAETLVGLRPDPTPRRRAHCPPQPICTRHHRPRRIPTRQSSPSPPVVSTLPPSTLAGSTSPTSPPSGQLDSPPIPPGTRRCHLCFHLFWACFSSVPRKQTKLAWTGWSSGNKSTD